MSRAFLLLILACSFLSACRHRQPVQESRELEWHSRIFASAIDAYLLSDGDRAIYLYDSIAHALKDPPVVVTFMRYDLQHAIQVGLRKDNASAIRYLDSAIGYLEAHRLTTEFPKTYFGLLSRRGQLSLFQGNYDQAYDYYLRSKQWVSAHLSPCEIAVYSYDLAMILYRQQKYEESRNYFRESFDQFSSCRRSVADVGYKQQEIADNIGLCYVKTNQYDSALAWFNRGLTIAQHGDSIPQHMRQMAQAVIRGNMAKVYVARNRLDTAADLFQKSLAVNAGLGYNRMDAQLVQAQLAEIYEKQNRYGNMLDMLRQLKAGLDTLPNPDALLSWNRLMAAYYKHTGQRLKRLAYYETFISMRDSASQVESAISKADIVRQVKEKEQELEITLLKKNNQLNRTYLVITISLVAIAILVVGFLYYIFRKTARLNRLVSSQKEELLHLNHVKNKLLSVVSHDMRTPVNTLASFIYLLENRTVSRESLLAYSQQLKQSLGHTSVMMENLLNWTASQMQGFKPVIERTGIRDIAEKVTGNTSGFAAEKQVVILNEIPATAAAGIDQEMFQVVLRNLLANAIKFSHPGGSIVLSAVRADQDGYIVVQVKDQGTGMAEEDVAKINGGNPDMLRSTAGTAREKGTGLGLHLCLVFVKMMKGSLRVESRKGEGTLFSVLLPV
ncbi:MAG: tetratricopeptide repeat-containing sensor histidine kinase [Chitinophagaceae bacterium]